MSAEVSIFEGWGRTVLSAEEKKRKSARDARIRRGLRQRADWTPEMIAAEAAQLAQEVQDLLSRREGDQDAAA